MIVAPFCSLPGEPGNNRFLHLASYLANHHEVTLVTSSFNHFEKKHRETPICVNNLNFQLINEPGYTSNVSIKRFFSHRVFVLNFKKWFLNKIASENFNLIYSAFPLIETNIFLGQVKSIFKFKLVVDVQDIWPESFSAIFPLILKIPNFLIPGKYKANKAFKAADLIIAVSKTYLDKAHKSNPLARGMVAYIGSDFNAIESSKGLLLDKKLVHFLYIGTLSHSYDIKTLLLAFERLLKEGVNFHLHIAGGGPDEKKLRFYMGSNVTFYGYMQYSDICSLAKGVDIFINPIIKDSLATITNKLSDYISFNKPIVSSQKGDEVNALISMFGGVCYESRDVNSLIKALKEQAFVLKRNRTDFNEFIYENFDRRRIYARIERFITQSKC
jgi:glycosyltransferase involved in cell wall biosynthesis